MKVNASGDLVVSPSQSEEAAIETLKNITRVIMVVGSTCVFVVGVSANGLAIRVLLKYGFRKNHQWLYLISLALSNICLLCADNSRFFIMGLLDIDYRLLHSSICFGHRWLTRTSILTSNWLMVLVIFSKWQFLRYQSRSILMYSTWCVAVSIMVLVSACGVFVAWTLRTLLVFYDVRLTGTHLGSCSTRPGRSSTRSLHGLMVYVPFLCLLTLSSLTLLELKGRHKKANNQYTIAEFQKRVYYRKMRILLVMANIHYLLNNLPLTFFYLTRDAIFDKRSALQAAKMCLVYRCGRLVLNGFYATNCIVYCLCESRLRNQFHRIFQWRDKTTTDRVLLENSMTWLGADQEATEQDKDTRTDPSCIYFTPNGTNLLGLDVAPDTSTVLTEATKQEQHSAEVGVDAETSSV